MDQVDNNVEIDVEIVCESNRAYKVYDGKVTVWIPKSQVSDCTSTDGKIESIFIPEWLAKNRGLI